jgi:hypothetical protein
MVEVFLDFILGFGRSGHSLHAEKSKVGRAGGGPSRVEIGRYFVGGAGADVGGVIICSSGVSGESFFLP